MKKATLLFLFTGIIALGFSQPKITNVSFTSCANLFGLYEIAFQSDAYSNPYDPDIIDIYAEFTAPDGQMLRVNGFYYEDYSYRMENKIEVAKANHKNDGWRIRFSPDQVGEWKFIIHAIDKNGHKTVSSIGSVPFTFKCNVVNNAKGFIKKANAQFLKQDVVKGGQVQSGPFFPIGPNIAWYTCKQYFDFTTPFGLYDYTRYVDLLQGNANYMRIWLNRYQFLSLYGPEYTQLVNGKPKVYFDATLNQKDAGELDHIIQYAAQHNIAVMPCIFTFGDFDIVSNYSDQNPSEWRNNPFNTILGLNKPCEFFTDAKAKKITKNLLRYIAARWGYATNIVSWELWNEFNNMDYSGVTLDQHQRNVVDWHNEMASYLRSQDPFHHLITTSTGGTTDMDYLRKNIFKNLDITQFHNYQNIHKARSKTQFSYVLYNLIQDQRELYPSKPVFIGEFAFGQDSPQKKYIDHDPHGIDIHNCLWSTMFSGSMGTASFWYWDFLREQNLFSLTKPMLNFSKNLPLLSDSFTAHITGQVEKSSLVFPNNIETYYMTNTTQDTIYGWSQDTAFCYQSLRHITSKGIQDGHFEVGKISDPKGYVYTLNPEKRPKPSSRDNTITLPITSQPVGTQYTVRWYDGETGEELISEMTTVTVTENRHRDRQISFQFPSSIRDVRRMKINNTYGDAVFAITKKTAFVTAPTKGSDPDTKVAPSPKKFKVVPVGKN